LLGLIIKSHSLTVYHALSLPGRTSQKCDADRSASGALRININGSAAQIEK
jgi:hypothetical protein